MKTKSEAGLKPLVEALEDRLALSGFATTKPNLEPATINHRPVWRATSTGEFHMTLHGGIFGIKGSPGSDSITVYEEIVNGVTRTHFAFWDAITSQDKDIYTEDGIQKIIFHGLAGDDKFQNDTDNECVAFGGVGNDTLVGGPSDDHLFGQGGDDKIYGRDGVDFLVGNSGNDTLSGGVGTDELQGNKGNDQLASGSIDPANGNWGGANELNTGDDLLKGGADNDSLLGGSGNDILAGNGGEDILIGYGGNDTFYSGNDHVLDHLYGGPEDGNVFCGPEDVADGCNCDHGA